MEIDEFPALDSNISVDVLIVGGGISGILLAYELNKRNIDYVLLEEDRIGDGISKNTTAFLTINHDYLYNQMIGDIGVSKAKEYLSLNQNAILEYKKLSSLYDFDFKECSNIIFSSYDSELLSKEKYALELLGVNVNEVDSIPFDIKFHKGLEIRSQAIIHPLKFIKCISKNLNIYEHTRIEEVFNRIAYTKNHKITFNKIVIATNYPIINRFGFYFTKLTQRRSYVVSIKSDKTINDTYTSIDENGLYIRNYKNYIIVGGNDRDMKNQCFMDFTKTIGNIFPKYQIEYAWSNQDIVTLDHIPYIGRIDPFHKNYYVITGFNLYGFTWAMAASKIIADMMIDNKQCDLVDPSRMMRFKPFIINLSTYLKNFFSFKTPRCTHMGSALHYNRNDDVYECPCHGSRFLSNGKVISGPAKKRLKDKR